MIPVDYYKKAAKVRIDPGEQIPNQNQTSGANNPIVAPAVVTPATTTPARKVGTVLPANLNGYDNNVMTDANLTGTPAPIANTANGTSVINTGTVDDYMNNMKGGFGKVNLTPVDTLDNYKKQAGTQLNSNLSKTLASLLANYTNNLAAYEGQKSSVGLNSASELAANNRNTTASQNNYSNSTLGRGLGRSTIATTGIGEIGVIGDRVNAETEARKTAALDAIDKMKAAAKVGYEANVLSTNDGYASDVDSLANDLYNKALSKYSEDERFNLGQDSALYQTAAKARQDVIDDNTQRYGYDKAYAKATEVAGINNDGKYTLQEMKEKGLMTRQEYDALVKKDLQKKDLTSKEKISKDKNDTTLKVTDKKMTSSEKIATAKNATSKSIAATKAAASAAKAALKAKNKKMSASALNVETNINRAGVAGVGNIGAKINYLDNDVVNEIKTNAKISSGEKAYLLKKVQEVKAAAQKQQKQFEAKTVKTKNTKAYMGNHGS